MWYRLTTCEFLQKWGVRELSRRTGRTAPGRARLDPAAGPLSCRRRVSGRLRLSCRRRAAELPSGG
jgi:hypothetical protein